MEKMSQVELMIIVIACEQAEGGGNKKLLERAKKAIAKKEKKGGSGDVVSQRDLAVQQVQNIKHQPKNLRQMRPEIYT